ncbi:hypothetical protein M3J09_002975 [Ascochyta lentis]
MHSIALHRHDSSEPDAQRSGAGVVLGSLSEGR